MYSRDQKPDLLPPAPGPCRAHWWSHPGPTLPASALQIQEGMWIYLLANLTNADRLKDCFRKHTIGVTPGLRDPGLDTPSLFNRSTGKTSAKLGETRGMSLSGSECTQLSGCVLEVEVQERETHSFVDLPSEATWLPLQPHSKVPPIASGGLGGVGVLGSEDWRPTPLLRQRHSLPYAISTLAFAFSFTP